MSASLDSSPDIVAAVVAYLQAAMLGSLGASSAWADYAPDGTAYPYAVVTEGPESYAYQSTDPQTGRWLDCLADGVVRVAFYATSKAQARALGRQSVRVLSDSQESIFAQDGSVVSIFPLQAESAVLGVEATAQPAAFLRIVTFRYKQEFGA